MVRQPARESALRAESGQTTVEYILLLAVLVGLFALVGRGLNQAGLAKQMLRPINEEFVYVYKYGHVDARGPDEGEVKMHPRFTQSGNFRLFLNPRPIGGP